MQARVLPFGELKDRLGGEAIVVQLPQRATAAEAVVRVNGESLSAVPAVEQEGSHEA